MPLSDCHAALIPVRGYAITLDVNDTIGVLRTKYLQARREAMTVAVNGGGGGEQSPDSWRLMHDGLELDDGATLEVSGLAQGARVAAVARRARRVALPVRVGRFAVRWWPACIGLLLCLALFAIALSDRGDCARPLRAFVIVGGLALLPYTLVLSGSFLEEHGHRLLWFLHFPPLTYALVADAVLSFAWLIAGGVWLFGGADGGSGSDGGRGSNGSGVSNGGSDGGGDCASAAPQLHGVAMSIWCGLLLVNLPWAVVLTTPCFALCKCPFAFGFIAFLAGVHRRPIET